MSQEIQEIEKGQQVEEKEPIQVQAENDQPEMAGETQVGNFSDEKENEQDKPSIDIMNNLNNGLSEFSGNNVIDDLTHINSSKDLPHKENDEKELDDRNKIYSTILENYSKYLKDTLNSNKSNKLIISRVMHHRYTV